MKTILPLVTLLASTAILILSGCSSSTASNPSPETLAQNRSKAASHIPPQAQSLTAQENQTKSQLDAQRAKDAAKSKQ